MSGTRSSRATASSATPLLHEESDLALHAQPLACADALARTADECARQRERLASLISRNVGRSELTAAHAIVETCDLALAECVSAYENACRDASIEDDAVRKLASSLWHAAREYLRRHSIADHAARLIKQHDAVALGDLHFEYELEASAALALRHGCGSYFKARPEAA